MAGGGLDPAGADQLELLPYAVTPGEGSGMLSMALNEFGFVFVYDQIRSGQVYGPPQDYVSSILDAVDSDVLLVEADSAGEIISSLQAGLASLPNHIAAALVVLGDQPRIQPKVVNQVLMAYAEGKGRIVAPTFQDERGHPILIDRRYWPELLALPLGGAPRQVINKYKSETALVPVDTDSVLQDVDTPADYRQARWQAGLDKS